MIGDNPERGRIDDLAGVSNTRVLARLLHYAGEQIDFVIAVQALQNGGHTLKPHSRIDPLSLIHI